MRADIDVKTQRRYRRIAALGQGGMATVFLTVVRGPAGFNKLLVVKELKQELTADPEFLRMFLDEARLAALLNHPNVVQTYEVGEEDGRYFIAMEYLEGQPLSSVLSRLGRANIPLPLHLAILSSVLAGLHYAHELTDFDGTPLGVVHRDVSPQNVFVTYDGHVKVVDFGIAKAAGQVSLTKAGIIKGKVGYMSPEQATAQTVDRRADIFAVGVLLWEALAGTRLAAGHEEIALLHRRITGGDPTVTSVKPDVPRVLAAICDRAMAHRPEDRYATAAQFQEELDAYLETAAGRLGSRSLAALVSDAFAEERSEIRVMVETQVKKADETTESQSLPLLDMGAHPSFHPGKTVTGASMAAHVEPTMRVASTEQKATSRRRVVFGGMAALAVVGTTIVVATRRSPPQSDRSTQQSNGMPRDLGDAAGSPANSIQLSIVLHPPEAKAVVEGVSAPSNPFRGPVPRDGLAHRITASASGYQPEERMVTFDRDISIELALKPAVQPSGSASGPVAKGADPARGSIGTPVGAGGKKVDPPVRKATRNIDETDPYGK